MSMSFKYKILPFDTPQAGKHKWSFVYFPKTQLGVGTIVAGLQGRRLKPMFSGVTEKADLDPRALQGSFPLCDLKPVSHMTPIKP